MHPGSVTASTRAFVWHHVCWNRRNYYYDPAQQRTMHTCTRLLPYRVGKPVVHWSGIRKAYWQSVRCTSAIQEREEPKTHYRVYPRNAFVCCALYLTTFSSESRRSEAHCVRPVSPSGSRDKRLQSFGYFPDS